MDINGDCWHEIVKEDENTPCRHFYSCDGKPNIFPPHFHRNIELMYILTGSITAIVGTKSYILYPGDIIIFNSNEIHTTNCTNDFTTAYIIQINISYMKEVSKYPEMPYFHIPPLHLDAIPEQTKYAIHMLQQMIQSYFAQAQKTAKYNYIYMQGILCQIIYCLYQYFQKEDINNKILNHRNFNRLSKIDQYIKSHYTENISLDDIASYVGLSSTYFSKNFHKIFGMTFSQYLCALRLKSAYEDIVSTDSPIMYISEKNGFLSYPLFQQKFKETYGITPSQCRKKYHKERSNLL